MKSFPKTSLNKGTYKFFAEDGHGDLIGLTKKQFTQSQNKRLTKRE